MRLSVRDGLNLLCEFAFFALLCWIVWRSALCFVTEHAIYSIPAASFVRFYVLPKARRLRL